MVEDLLSLHFGREPPSQTWHRALLLGNNLSTPVQNSIFAFDEM